ncbi:MAG: transmembrane protein [uncultured bacterium]|nr:MAG: transmembrane protein [uncultured bacterium]
MLTSLLSFVISLLIGLLLGIERERSHPEGVQAIGVRTFILFALLGTLAAFINQSILTAAICLFVFGIILISYFRSTTQARKNIDIGITTEVAAAIVFALGYIVPSFPLTAITVSAVVLLVLIERKRLHVFSRQKLKPQEIESLIILIIFGLGVLPVLPNHTIDPWNFFNPRNVGILFAAIASIQFAGYIAIRLFGQLFGRAVIGFFGGLVSSTAVFATLRDTLNGSQLMWATMASAILSIVAIIIEFAIILLVASPTLLTFVMWPLITMGVISSMIAALLLHLQKEKIYFSSKNVVPLKLSSILLIAMLIMFILFFIAITKYYIGTQGTLFAAFISGLFELHGVALATGLLYFENQMKLADASAVLAIAFLASFVSKFILLWVLTPRYFALRLSALLLIILASGTTTYLLLI